MLQKDISQSNTELFTSTKNYIFLEKLYFNYIYYSFAIGVDNINHERFNFNWLCCTNLSIKAYSTI